MRKFNSWTKYQPCYFVPYKLTKKKESFTMSKENKPSLKKSQKEIKAPALVLTSDEYKQLHENVIIPFEVAIDNKRNNDELFSSIAKNLIALYGLKPSYAMFMLCRDESEKALMNSKNITKETFKNHYWKYVREFLEVTEGFEFPKSTSESAIKDRKSTRLNSSHIPLSRMPSSA